MDVPLKFLLFLSLVVNAATLQLETDYVIDPDESIREYIRDQNEVMRKFLTNEMQKMFATMTKTFGDQLQRSDVKVTTQLGSHDEILQRNHQQISRSISNLTTALFPVRNLTEVEEVNLDNGTIQFSGGTNPHLRTKIWVLRSKGQISYRMMFFVLEENGLGEDARLSLWSSIHDNGDQRMWNGSQADWRQAKLYSGNVILVTLRISAGGVETPSFKLKFTTAKAYDGFLHSSEILDGEGRQEISFPPNNSQEFSPRSRFVAVVASPRGGSFALTLKYLDLPGTSPTNCDNKFVVWFLQENSTGFPFRRLPSSVVRPCGRVGAISEHLGNATVAILWFYSQIWYDDPVGKGFRVQIN